MRSQSSCGKDTLQEYQYCAAPYVHIICMEEKLINTGADVACKDLTGPIKE